MIEQTQNLKNKIQRYTITPNENNKYKEFFWFVILIVIIVTFFSKNDSYFIAYYISLNYFLKRRYKYVYEIVFDNENKQVVLKYETILRKNNILKITYPDIRFKLYDSLAISANIIRIYYKKKNFIHLKCEIRSDYFQKNFKEIHEYLKNHLKNQ